MLEKLENEALLRECKVAVCAEKQCTARVLEYLAEIDRRRIWVMEGYSSLFDFCLRYLKYSEGETHRRIQACRLIQRVEEVKPLLEEGTLSLTTASLLSPYLNQENAAEILPQVVHQPTREVEKILKHHFPEMGRKGEILKVEVDEELKSLLERAKLLASENDAAKLLKKVFNHYLREKKTRSFQVKHHTRYVQEHIAREVKERDGFQCTYVSPNGIRCNQRLHLQIDHIRPWAKGGSSREIDNLRCLCRAHNLFLAKKEFPDFGERNPSQGSKKEPIPRRNCDFA